MLEVIKKYEKFIERIEWLQNNPEEYTGDEDLDNVLKLAREELKTLEDAKKILEYPIYDR